MSKIVVNGVDGNFGELVAKYVLDLVDKKDLVFTAPKIEKLKEYQEMGIAVVKANFNDIAGLVDVFKDADKVLLISMPFVGENVE